MILGLELCGELNVNGEEFAASWIGYAANKGIDEVDIDLLEQFARDEANKKKKASRKGVEKFPKHDVATLHNMYPFY